MTNKGNLIGGAILILLGLFFLAAQFMPALLGRWFSWPMILIAIGGVFLILAFLTRIGGLAIPGSIVGGIGLILNWQNATGNWESWAYMWTLIPGFVGLGIVLASVLDPQIRKDRKGGFTLIVLSLLGFFIFGGAFGLGWDVVRFWPVILILIGIGALVGPLFRASG